MPSIERAAFDEALAAGHHSCGEEHLLVAWLASDLPAPARQELARRGVSAERARSALPGLGRDPASTWVGEGTMSAPSWHTARGRAGGLALADDRIGPTADELARACVWDEGGRAGALLSALGCTRDDVLDVTGPLPPDRPAETLLPAAQAQAAALEDGYVGDIHVVLALLAGQPDGLGARVLASCGVTWDRMIAAHRATGSPPAPADPDQPATPSPACRGLLGRAQGLAAARQAGSVRSEDALTAWMWRDDGQASGDLEHLGVAAPAVLVALRQAGVVVPAVALPQPDRRAWGEKVTFPADRLAQVKAGLHRRLDPTAWGWNVDGEVAWVVALAGIDLQRLVDELLA